MPFKNPLTDLASVISVDTTGNVTFTKNVVSNGTTINSPATSSSLGLVKIGSGITVDANGVISASGGGGNATVSNATTSSTGVVQIGNNINVNNGVISVANPISAPNNWVSFAINGSGGLNEFAVAIKSDGTLWAWGNPNQSNDLTSSGIAGGTFNQLGIGSSWVGVAAGYATGYAIRSDGLLYAWGDGSYGQLGQGDTLSRGTLTGVGLNSWKMVSAGGAYAHVLAIRSDGTLWGWGLNNNGQLGDNTATNKSSPVQVGTSSWSFITAGNGCAMGIRADGTLWAWGYNGTGQLGDGTTANKSSPVQIGTNSWSSVAVYNHTAALDVTGNVYVWGYNSWGQLGDNTTVSKSSPVQIGAGFKWSAVGIGFPTNAGVTTLIRSDGTMWSTGYNGSYMVGTNNATNYSSPVQIGVGTSWKSVAGDPYVMLALSASGTLYGWGNPQYSGLGSAYGAAVSSPVVVSAATTLSVNSVYLGTDLVLSGNTLNFSATGVTAGTYGSASAVPVITVDAKGRIISAYTVASSGGGGGNATVSNATTSSTGVVQIGNNINVNNGVISVANASNTVLGVIKAGTDITIDASAVANLSTTAVTAGTYGSSSTVPVVTVDTKGRITNAYTVAITGGGSSSSNVVSASIQWVDFSVNGAGGTNELGVAIKTDGSLWVWGSPNQSFDLTSGGSTGGIFNQIGTGYSWVGVGTAYATGYAIRSDGYLFTWGDGSAGQTGQGDTTNRGSLTQIGNSSWKMVVGGPTGTFALAIRSDGTLWSWGANYNGNLGVGDTVNRSSPVQIGTSSWSFVTAGNFSAMAIRADGTLWGWGNNGQGQIGDGTYTSKSSPVQIGTSLWSFVAQYNHTAAIDVTGRLFTWGDNGWGQLGQGTQGGTTNSPAQIGSGFSWKNVGVGFPNNAGITTAVRSDGTMWSMGYNGYYAVGTNNSTNYSSPVQIGVGTTWKKAAGEVFTMFALASNGALYGWGTPSYGGLGPSYGAAVSSPVVVSGTTTLSTNSVFLGTDLVLNGNTLNFSSTGVAAGTYGSSSSVPVMSVDAKGRITGVYTVAVANATNTVAGVIKAGTDLTVDANAVANLATTAVTSGTYGNATAIPVVTVDSKGRITNAYTVAFSGGGGNGSVSVATTSSTGVVQIGQNINITGGGVISVANATNTTAGVVMIGSDFITLSNGSTVLSNTGVIANTYGNTTQTLQITVDSKGRISNAGVSGVSLMPLSGGTFTGPVGLNVTPASGVKLDISGTVAHNITALANSTVDLSTGNFFSYTVSTNTTFTFNNPPASRAFVFAILLTNGGSSTVAWPASVKWASATAPTLTTSGVDLLTFASTDGGATYRAIPSILDSR